MLLAGFGEPYRHTPAAPGASCRFSAIMRGLNPGQPPHLLSQIPESRRLHSAFPKVHRVLGVDFGFPASFSGRVPRARTGCRGAQFGRRQRAMEIGDEFRLGQATLPAADGKLGLAVQVEIAAQQVGAGDFRPGCLPRCNNLRSRRAAGDTAARRPPGRFRPFPLWPDRRPSSPARAAKLA